MRVRPDLSSPDIMQEDESLQRPQIEHIIGINQKQLDLENPNLQFFLKLKDKKYQDCIWIKKSEIETITNFESQLIAPFQQYLNESQLLPVPFVSSLYKPDNISFDESFFCPEEIIYDKTRNRNKYFLVKWVNLGIDQATWEDNSDQCIPEELIEDYNNSKNHPNPIDIQTSEFFQNSSQFIPYFESPVYKNDNRLTSYQLDGLNWLIHKWYNNHNSILADEPGIGKKVECVALTEEINKVINGYGPYLVITDLPTIRKWSDEFKKWTNLRILEYNGNEKQLSLIYDYQLFTDDSKTFIKYDVVIASIETFTNCFANFRKIRWICIYIDNLIPQNLRNSYFDKLEKMCNHFLIITDQEVTSLPLMILYSLFHMIDNETFSDSESFIQIYSNPDYTLNMEQFDLLSQEYILKRSKTNVDPFTSNFDHQRQFYTENQIVIEVEQTPIQLEIYRRYFIEERSTFIFDENIQHNLYTIRKIANHPLLIESEFKKFKREVKSEEEELKAIIQSSGKMIVLDKLLTKFKSMNHSVLILANMNEMVNLIELYLQKSSIPYSRLDGSNGEVNKTRQNNEKVLCFLTSIGHFKYDLSDSDTAIIYDGHFTPAPLTGKTIYRFFTRGTIEEDLFIKFTIKKDYSAQSKEEVNFLMRRNAYFAFHGQIDNSFFTEPIEKTIEYRTDIDIQTPDEVDDHDFWLNLFKEQDKKKLKEISMDKEQLRSISRSIINLGCFETHNRFHKESHNNFFLVCLVYMLYKSIQEDKRNVFKHYIQKVKKISREIIVSKEILTIEPFSSEIFVDEMFGNDSYTTMLKIFSIDRIYTCLSFMSMSRFNQIGFIFGQSMNIPVYWNDHYDYTLLYTSFMFGNSQSNVKMFQKNLENIGILVGYIPTAKPPFPSETSSSNSANAINLPSPTWLKNRISLIVSEFELIAPSDFYPSTQPLAPSEWVSFYRPDSTIHLETRNMVKRVLRFLYLFGLPLKQVNSKITILKKKMMLNSTPDDIIASIIYSLIKSAANMVKSMPNSPPQPSLISRDKQSLELARSKEISNNMYEALMSSINELRPIRSIDVSWVKKEALLTLAKQLIFFIRIRNLYENVINNRIPFVGFPKWNNAPKWWNYACNIEFIHVVASFGFIFLSCMKNLTEISSKLTQSDKDEINNFRIYEKKMMGDIKIDLPESLSELSFLKKIESRIFILQKLLSLLSTPNINLISNYLPANQTHGLIVINFGTKNNNGYPIGYNSIRFYRGTQKKSNSFSSSSQFQKNPFKINKSGSNKAIKSTALSTNNEDGDFTYYSFSCMLKIGPDNLPLFIIKNQDDQINKMFEVGAYSVSQVYDKFINTLIHKGIERPPPYFDGYEFFGFRNKFVRSFITTS